MYQLVYRVGGVWWLCIAVRVSHAVSGYVLLFLFPCRYRASGCIVGLLRRYLIHVGHFWQWDVVVAQETIPQETFAPDLHQKARVHIVRFTG